MIVFCGNQSFLSRMNVKMNVSLKLGEQSTDTGYFKCPYKCAPLSSVQNRLEAIILSSLINIF